MSDQRPDDEVLGRALARAIDAQTVRQTAFSQSRVARRLDGPASRGWLSTLAVAAALGLFVAMGAFFISRGPFGAANPGPSPSPDPSPATTATASPAPTASATASATATATGTAAPTATASPNTANARLYFARDGLPPISTVAPIPAGEERTAAQRIGSRVGALINDVVPPPAGAIDAFDGRQLQGVTGVTVAGDLATVDLVVAQGDWGVRGAAQTQALLQQLVYTATEEPGLRRIRITENGGKTPTIDQLVVDKPLSREDVHGYVAQPLSERITTSGSGLPTRAAVTNSVDAVAPGLARVVITLTPVTGQFGPLGYVPLISAEVKQNDDLARPAHGKYTLVLQVDGIEGSASSTRVDRTPLRAIHFTPGTNAQRTATYELALDDLRPWRVAILKEPARVVVDIGGHPGATVLNTTVYSPRPGATVDRDFTVSGLARAFEANVSWRLRDAAGREVARGFTTASEGSSAVWGTYEFRVQAPASVSGSVTLDVYQASPRDGSDTYKVELPLQIR